MGVKVLRGRKEERLGWLAELWSGGESGKREQGGCISPRERVGR